MDFDTLERVKALSPEAAQVVRWGIKLEGALHTIADHPDVHGNDVSKMRKIARDAIRPPDSHER